MTDRCTCTTKHKPRRVVLTGGPGAGKTAVLEMLAHDVCRHVLVTREAAGILFSGGFPRRHDDVGRRAAQRAIFHVQLELEAMLAETDAAIVLFDRGLVDGSAYWPGPGDFWSAVGMRRDEALGRYDAVVHLRSPSGPNGYGHQNPLRTETVGEALAIDQRIFDAWIGHPHRYIVEATPDFLTKAERALTLIRGLIPACCARQSLTTSTGHSAPAITEPTTLPRTAGKALPIP